jgi:hypothetical protein
MALRANLQADVRQHADECSDDGQHPRFHRVVVLGVAGWILAWAAPLDSWVADFSAGLIGPAGAILALWCFLVAIAACSPRERGRCALAWLAAYTAFPVLLVGIPFMRVPPMGMVVAVYAFTFIAAVGGGPARKPPFAFATALAASCYFIVAVGLGWQVRVWPTFLP